MEPDFFAVKTCVHNGVTYRDGESYMNECNTCMCSNGQSICTLMACRKFFHLYHLVEN
jgi:hypothetical protein